MHAEIITTGTELLLGETVDTNSAYIARALRGIGLDLYYLITVGDNEHRLADMLQEALGRSDVIITTGGLGPTIDDVTRQAVARATDRELILMPELLADIETFFTRFGRQMTENNRRQAYMPAGAIPIHNRVGTAPGFIVEDQRGTIISLPGVPREMEYLMQRQVLPYLSQRLGTQVIQTRILRTCAIGESTIDSLIGDLEQMSNPSLGLAAHPGQTDIRITAKGQSKPETDQLIDRIESQVRERLGDVIYGVDHETLESVVVRLLSEADQSIAIVESNTEGLIAQRLRTAMEELDEAGSLLMAKTLPLFGTPMDDTLLLEQAQEIARTSGADVVLFVAGTGDKDQGVYGAEPGQTRIALITPTQQSVRPFRFGGRDPHTQQWIAVRALDMIRRGLLGLSLDIQ